MSQQIVEQVKAQLVEAGQEWKTNEDAFEITGRVAWKMRGDGAKLIQKRPEQNGASYHGKKYSHDAIAFPSGWIDCLAGAGPELNHNTPIWSHTGTDESAVLADPFDMDASTPVPTPTSTATPTPGPTPPTTGCASSADILLANQRLVELFGKLDTQHKETLDAIAASERRVITAMHNEFEELRAEASRGLKQLGAVLAAVPKTTTRPKKAKPGAPAVPAGPTGGYAGIVKGLTDWMMGR